MTEPHLPIYERVMHDVEDLLRPHGYHEPSTPATAAQEAPVDLATIEADARGILQGVIAHGEQLAADAKNVLENHLPQLVGEAAKVQGSVIVQTIEGLVLTPAQEQVIADIIAKAASLWPEPAPADVVPADPQGPAVAGVA